MKATLLIIAVAFATFTLIWALSVVAIRVTGVPEGFPPFTALPLLSGVIGGFLSASAGYALIRHMAVRPDRTFFFVAIAFLALSFALPLRLSFTRSLRFAGVTPSAQMVLALFHTIIAVSCVTALTRLGSGVR